MTSEGHCLFGLCNSYIPTNINHIEVHSELYYINTLVIIYESHPMSHNFLGVMDQLILQHI